MYSSLNLVCQFQAKQVITKALKNSHMNSEENIAYPIINYGSFRNK